MTKTTIEKNFGQQEKNNAFIVKIATTFVVFVLLALIFCINAFAADKKYNFPEGAADVNITLDSRSVLENEAAIMDSVTYVPLRTFSELCGADSVSWDSTSKTATVKKDNLTVKISQNKRYIEANGRYIYFENPIKNIDDRLFVPIRPISTAFSLDLTWNAKTRTVVLKSTNNTLTSGEKYYNSDDIYWLARIINAEASGEELRGKIAVGNVVLNRKASSSYPNTIYGVIFDRKYGTQFTPVAIGTIYNTPRAESVIAAKICLEGYTLSNEILYFMNPRIATNNWISQNRPFAFRIGNHNFYK